LIGLLHDAHEAYVGDIVTPLKRRLTVDTMYAQPGYIDFEQPCMEEVCAAISIEIFKALIPGMTDGCETAAEAMVWHRADAHALLTELRDLFDHPPVGDWHMRIDGSADARPLWPAMSCRQAEARFFSRYADLFESCSQETA